MLAFCWASGQIGFGRETPKGALPFAKGRPRVLRPFVDAVARHAYDGKTLLVPGIPEAPNQTDAGEALERFIEWLATHPRGGITVFTRDYRDRL